MFDVGLVIREIVKAGARPAIRRAQRQLSVLRTLKKLGIDPSSPPDDFETLYAYALVQHLWGQPPFVVRFFESRELREAFRASFDTGDWSRWRQEADQIMLVEEDDRRRDWIDYDPRRQLDDFAATFFQILDGIRSPTEVRRDHHAKELIERISEGQTTTGDIADKVDKLLALQSDLASLVDERLPSRAEAGEYHGQVFDWLRAVGYRIERTSDIDGEEATATIEVPVRRGRFERVLVRSLHREAGVEDVELVAESAAGQRVDEAWLVASRRVTQSARNAAEESIVACYTFDELIDQDADFEPYLDWLDEEIRRRGIDSNYVELGGFKEEFNRAGQRLGQSVFNADNGWLDGYVDTWLDDSSTGHLSLLGEFGTGKSWFCLHYAWALAQKYRDAKERGTTRPRLPIIIPLRDYAKAVHVESLFSEFFFRKHELNLPGYSAFEQLNRMGRLFLIFDGFDEMAARIDRQAMVNNFWELARAVVPGAKVLLTCRTEHFPAAREGRSLLSAELKASTSNLTGESPQFEVMQLMPWDDDQVHRVLSAIADPDTVATIEAHEELRDLMRRPVMSELVLDALPEVRSGAPVDTTRVYLYAVRRKMSRDIKNERTFTSLAEKMFFLCELSWEMLSTDSMSLNYRLIPDRIRDYFGGVVKTETDLDHWHYDMMGQTMLIRNSEGDYFPAHRSLSEFFVAFKIVAELGLLSDEYLATLNEGRDPSAVAEFTWDSLFASGTSNSRHSSVERLTPIGIEKLARTLGSEKLTPSTMSMMVAMMDVQADTSVARLIEVLRKTRSSFDTNVDLLGGNCATLAVRIRADALAGVDLSGTSVAGAMFDLGLDGAILDGANFDGADCRQADFERASLKDVTFRGADLLGAENIGYSDACVRWIEPISDDGVASLVLANDGRLSVLHHEDGVREERCWLGRDLFEVELSPGGKYGLAAGPGVTVIEIASGQIVFTSQEHSGGVFVVSEGDSEASEIWVRGSHLPDTDLERIELRDGRIQNKRVAFSDNIVAGFWCADVSATVIVLRGGLIVPATLQDGDAHLGESIALRLPVPEEGSIDDNSISYMHGMIVYRWSRTADDGVRVRVVGVDGHGREIADLHYLVDSQAFAHHFFTKADRTFEMGSCVVTLDPDGVRVHQSGAAWHVADPSLTEVQASSSGNVLMFADRYGNVGEIEFPSLERRYISVWDETLSGADFSNARGLTEVQRRVFEVMGARCDTEA